MVGGGGLTEGKASADMLGALDCLIMPHEHRKQREELWRDGGKLQVGNTAPR